MAVTSHVYPKAVDAINKKTINLTTDAFRCALFTGSASAWTATQQVYQFVSDLKTAYTECANADYLAATNSGRIPLTTLTLTTGTAPGTDKWTCTAPAPISWGAAVTISAASMCIYDFTIGGGVDSATPVIAVIDFGVTVSSTAGPYTYTVDPTNGLALFTTS
jgi:hypothetical protein